MFDPTKEEMVSALIDGELSPEDQALVEAMISSDETMKQIYDSFLQTSAALKESAGYVDQKIALPADFSSRVMSQIAITQETTAQEKTTPTKQEMLSTAAQGITGQANVTPSSTDSVWSARTWLELVAAVAAVLVIVLVWQGKQPAQDPVAKPDPESNQNQRGNFVAPKNGVSMMGSEDGKFKSDNQLNPGGTPSPTVKPSREFSIFVNADARPEIDRFWILNDYQVEAPEGTDPRGHANSVNVLLIDAKKTDALSFLEKLGQWDSGFKVFQEAKTGAASWLAPFDVAKANEAEGDFWTLQIVLIRP